MKRVFTGMLIFFACTTQISAQRTCSFYTLLKTAEQSDQTLKNKKENFEKSFSSFKQDLLSGRFKFPDTIFIPVVVHVLWHVPEENIIDSQVISQIRILNEDFNDRNADRINTPDFFKSLRGKTHFFFRLAKQDPDNLPTNGIDRHYTFKKNGFGLNGTVNFTALGGWDAWDPRYYVNIWCCNMEKASGTFAATYFPGGSLLRDGIQCDYHYMGTGGITQPPYNLGRTITHEMGHYFNLDHVWGPSDITSVPFCGDDDHVEDTPPQGKANYYCPAFPRSSCANYSDMFMNYMDYTDDGCMNMFSKGQAERMLAAYYIMTPYLQLSKALQKPEIFPQDAGVKSILNPVQNSFTCDKKIKPRIVIRNYGSDTLMSVKLIYGIRHGVMQYAVLNDLQLPPFTTDTLQLDPLETSGTGSLTFIAAISPNANHPDAQSSNDSASIFFNINNGTGASLPFYESFSNHFFPPRGWSVVNPDKTFTWTPTNGSQLSGYAPSVMMDNIEYPFEGEKDMLITPPLNLSGTVQPHVLFSHAYQLYENGRTISDTLEINVSADCGKSWQRAYYKGGKDLASKRPPEHGYFSPDKKIDWQTDTIDLKNYAGIDNILIAFVNINGKDNLLYLDEIKVEDVTATPIPKRPKTKMQVIKPAID